MGNSQLSMFALADASAQSEMVCYADMIGCLKDNKFLPFARGKGSAITNELKISVFPDYFFLVLIH